MLADAPPEDKVMARFADFSKDTILVAHNASFDMGFLNETYARLGMPVLINIVIRWNCRLVN